MMLSRSILWGGRQLLSASRSSLRLRLSQSWRSARLAMPVCCSTTRGPTAIERAPIYPADSPTYIGQSAGNGSNSVSPGSLNFAVANQLAQRCGRISRPTTVHQTACSLTTRLLNYPSTDAMLTAEMKFVLPEGATARQHQQELPLWLILRSDQRAGAGRRE